MSLKSYKLSNHGKLKIKKIRETVPILISDQNQTDNYLNLCLEQRKSGIIAQHLNDFMIKHDTLNNSKIPYFCYDKWNFREAYLICIYSGRFNINTNKHLTNEIYVELMKIGKEMRRWSSSDLISFLSWLNQKPDFSDKSSPHSFTDLLYCQCLDILFQYPTYQLNTNDIIARTWQRDNKYCIIEYNLYIDPSFSTMFIYNNDELQICSHKYSFFNTLLDLMGVINDTTITLIIDLIKDNKRSSKRYFNLDNMSIVTNFQANKLPNKHDSYSLCGSNSDIYLKYLDVISKRVSLHSYRLHENLDIIRSNLLDSHKISKYFKDGHSYINLDTWKKNKTSGNKHNINHPYLIISDDIEKFNYFLNLLNNTDDIPPLLIPDQSPTGTIFNTITDHMSNSVRNTFNGFFSPQPPVKPPKKTKTRRKGIPQAIRYKVWRNAFSGDMDGRCYSCLDPISFETWECGHILAHAEGGSDTEDNLRPICRSCNKSMSAQNMLSWMKEYKMPGLNSFS